MEWRLALKNLTRNRRRTLAILLTVALGSGSLFIFHAFNLGIMNQYRSNTIHSRYGHGQLNQKGYRDQVFEKPWEHWIQNWAEIERELKETPGVKYVFPRIEFFALLTNGRTTVSGRGQGVDGIQESQFFNTLNIVDGKPLSDQPDGILLGRGLAKSLSVQVGDRLTALVNTVQGSMNGADFTVVGIFHTGSKEFDDAMFRVPLAQAQRLMDIDRVESIALGLNSVEDWAVVSKRVAEQWPELEATPFAVLDEVYYQHSVDWLKSQFDVIRIIILTIVILGIFNTISIGILDRKQEIGNLRANGESSWDVMRLLILEGAFLGILGAMIGLGASWSVNTLILKNGILMPPAPGLTRQFKVFLEFENSMAVSAFLLSLVTALLATFLAAYKVARGGIAELLRSI